jgi:hypothetical protein
MRRPNMRRPNMRRPNMRRPNMRRPDTRRPNTRRPNTRRPCQRSITYCTGVPTRLSARPGSAPVYVPPSTAGTPFTNT